MSQCIKPLLCKNATPLAQSRIMRSRTRSGTFGTSFFVVIAKVFRESDSMANTENLGPWLLRSSPSSGSLAGLFASIVDSALLEPELKLPLHDMRLGRTFGSL
jgi:hypothetical protein